MRKEYCPKCEKPVVGLYQNIRNENPNSQWKRRALYCKNCNIILKDDEIVYKKVIYEKRLKQ